MPSTVDHQPDPVLDLLDRMLADIHRLNAEVSRLLLDYGNLRRDTASRLADSTPSERARYVSPSGDRRERPVHCQRCRVALTWALDARCDPCAEAVRQELAS